LRRASGSTSTPETTDMANVKISQLPAATSPVAPADIVPIVQDGTTKQATVNQFGFLSATAATASTVAAQGISETTNEGFFQITRPLLWSDGNYVNRNSVITLRRDVPNPTSVQSMIHVVALGKGDNASVKGVTGAYFYVADRSDVDATNKGCLYGISSVVVPRVARNNIPYDDVTGLIVQHGGAAGTRGTDAMYIGRNDNFLNDDQEWITGLTCGANVGYGFRTSAATFVGFNASGRMAGVSGLAYGFFADGEIQASVTTNAYGVRSQLKTAPSSALGSLFHFSASRGTNGAGSTITSQYGYYASSALTGATNNYGFLSDLAAATGVWAFYSRGTAQSYFGGDVTMKLSTSVTPAGNSELMIERTSNTQLTFRVKGSDGVVRSNTLTLA